MKKLLVLMVVVMVGAVLASAPLVWAGDVQAKVKSMDQSARLLTLDTGIQLKIPETVTVDTHALQPGTDVKVSYQTQGSDHIVTAIQVNPPAK